MTTKKSIKKSDAPQQSLIDKFIFYNNLSDDIISDNHTIKQNIFAKQNKKNAKSSSKSEKGKHLTIHSRVLSLALKFYPEQLLNYETRAKLTDKKTKRIDYSKWTDGDILKLSRDYLNERIKNFSTYYNREKGSRSKAKRHWQVIAIFHDSDEVANVDDMFLPSAVKPHFHVIVRDANVNRFNVYTVLRALGLHYQKEDSQLFYDQGCTTIHDFNAYTMYLTHDTEKAIIDGKTHYDISELMTNLSLDEIQDLREGYKRLQKKSKLSEQDWNQLAEYVAQLGDKMEDFDSWANDALTFVQRASQKFTKLRDVYNTHLNKAVESSPDLIRCCILISGNYNDGKSYTSRHALQNLHEVVYNARSNTGKYDGLTNRATAMIFDDRKMSDALNLMDNRATILHSRGTGNDKVWLGRYVVVTTNLSPTEFFSQQGYQNDTQINALQSRMYVTHLLYDNNKNGKLVLDYPSTRGTSEDIKKRNKLYTRFADEFNRLIKNYHPLNSDNAPKISEKYYSGTYQDFGDNESARLMSENSDLRKQNLTNLTKLNDLILLLKRLNPNSNFYFISSTDDNNADDLLKFLDRFDDNSRVFVETNNKFANNLALTVKELKSKLMKFEYGQSSFPFDRNIYSYIQVE